MKIETIFFGMNMIGITGITGEIGFKTFISLKNKGIKCCGFVRDISSARRVLDHVELREFNFDSPNSEIFKGITSLFWILPNQHEQLIQFEEEWLTYVKQAGVEHIVKLSTMLAENNWYPTHFISEENIKALGIPYTHLRPNTFMQNFNRYDADNIKNKQALFYPAGVGKTSFIDTRDIADVAAEILLHNNRHLNKIYVLTGSMAYDYNEVTELFSQVLGRKIKYIDTYQGIEESPAQSYRDMIIQNFFRYLRQGAFSAVTEDVANILGKSARQLESYICDYRDSFC